MNKLILSNDFYKEYYGHPPEMLREILEKTKDRPKIYLAGDSTMDNKYWISEKGNAINGYENILDSFMKKDVSFHINQKLYNYNSDYICINTAVEEACIKSKNTLNTQDMIISEHITKNDILLVSIGGNDIALHPSFSTIINIVKLMYFNRTKSIKNGTAWGLQHFINLFHIDLQNYIEKLVQHRKPKKIVIAMLYFPGEKIEQGWANIALTLLGYNRNPLKLQTVILQMFELAIKKIKIDGVEIDYISWVDALDSKDQTNYVERVEPSCTGGEKMAIYFLQSVFSFRPKS